MKAFLKEKLAEAESAMNNAKAAADRASSSDQNLIAIKAELARAVEARKEAEKNYNGEHADQYIIDAGGHSLQEWKKSQMRQVLHSMTRYLIAVKNMELSHLLQFLIMSFLMHLLRNTMVGKAESLLSIS